MKTRQPLRAKSARFLVLVPHRDSRLLLRKWSESLFQAGFPGAWSFPWAAPLGVLSRPLSASELKHCARSLRESTLSGEKPGITGTGPVSSLFFPDSVMRIFGRTDRSAAIAGPVLEITVPESAFSGGGAEKITCLFPRPVIGCCLLRDFDPKAAPDTAAFPCAPEISFRTAALANMLYFPLETKEDSGYSFAWKIGEPHWLPRIKRKKGYRYV